MLTILCCAADTDSSYSSQNHNSIVEKTPKVSVSIITYNHKAYIGRAIESVLKQRVNFDYEIIVGDDCSTDGTQELVKSYQQRYADQIQTILHPTRYRGIPGRLNNVTNLYACRGQYIAMLDGDDYWISADKLQRQVDFLDQHPDYALTFHDIKVVSEDDEAETHYDSERRPRPHQGTTFTHQEVAEGWFIQTSTMLFRNHLIGEFPSWFWQIYSADYAIQLLVSQHGATKLLNNLEAVRWVHPRSFTTTQWGDLLVKNKLMIDDLNVFSEHFPALRRAIKANHLLAKRYFVAARLSWQRKKYRDALVYFFNCASKDMPWIRNRIKQRVQLMFG